MKPTETQSTCHAHGSSHSCGGDTRKADWLLRISLLVIASALALHFLSFESINSGKMAEFTLAVWELISKMWWGVLFGLVFVGLLSHVPKEAVMKMLGSSTSKMGIVRACLAGVLLDLCSHGILLVGMKLYERGAGIGQVMAFLIASPWNSISLTFIMIALIGFGWTMLFIALSLVIAIISGFIFLHLVKVGVLPANPNSIEADTHNFSLKALFKGAFKAKYFRPAHLTELVKNGWADARMVLRWLFFGVVLAAAIRALIPTEIFQQFFGASLIGLMLTLIAATVIEVCSEGSTPIAADLLTRAKAPGNSFAFLMTGVSTDYTEIMGIKETTKSWKIALFLPLVTLPQVIALSVLINYFGAST